MKKKKFYYHSKPYPPYGEPLKTLTKSNTLGNINIPNDSSLMVADIPKGTVSIYINHDQDQDEYDSNLYITFFGENLQYPNPDYETQLKAYEKKKKEYKEELKWWKEEKRKADEEKQEELDKQEKKEFERLKKKFDTENSIYPPGTK